MDTRKSDAIYEILLQKGFAESLCREIAYKYMNTDYTDRIIKKHEMEQAQAAINRIYNEGLE